MMRMACVVSENPVVVENVFQDWTWNRCRLLWAMGIYRLGSSTGTTGTRRVTEECQKNIMLDRGNIITTSAVLPMMVGKSFHQKQVFARCR